MSGADDLVLVSESAQGLQKCLNDLSNYCGKWGLTVNTAKTKCMVMSSTSRVVKSLNFHYDGQT